MRITFEEISCKATKVWIENGRRRQRTKKFWQTLSPFNRNADGTLKTDVQIRAELVAERDAWLKQDHNKGIAHG